MSVPCGTRSTAGDHLLLRFGIEANVTCNGLADKSRADQLADSPAGHRRIIRNNGEIAFSLADQLIDHAFGCAHRQKTSDHEARTIWNHGDGVLKGDRFHRLRATDPAMSR
jgi:hypothetical protein